MFIHLHNHTEYSLLDGASKVDALVDRIESLGQTAVAITDHGWMAGAIKLTKLCKPRGIKPIIGSEVYIATQEDMRQPAASAGDNFHLTLLCATPDGYSNLRRLTSLGYKDGFHWRPRIDKRTLAANADGIIALSGCVAAELPSLIIDDKMKEARRLVAWYQKVFGDRFFIELMSHGSTGRVDHVRIERNGKIIMGESELNAALVSIAHAAGVAVVATNDAHYLTEEDGDAHDTLFCMQSGKWKGDPQRTLIFPGVEHAKWEFYVKSEREMKAMSKDKIWREACDNTITVADMVQYDVIPMGKVVLPKFEIPHDPGFEIWRKTGMLI